MLRPFRGVAAFVVALVALTPPAATAVEPLQAGPSCTVVYAADGQVAIGGNNEDGFNPLTKIWFVPGVDGGHGSVWVGYDDYVIQGGMNDAGLFFDGLAVRDVTVPPKPGKPEFSGGSAWTYLMSTCDSVACVRAFFESTSLPGTWNGQALFGDRFGSSAIMEPLTVVPMEGRFQVATNFFQSEVAPADRTDERYVAATALLAARDRFSTDIVRDVLRATRQEGDVNTLYSTVYDLKARTIDLYAFADFGTKVTFDLRAELAKGLHGFDVRDLFAPNERADAIAAPIQSRLDAAIEQLPHAVVTGADLAPLAATYRAPDGSILETMAGDGILLARQSWTPWVPLRSESTTSFSHVFSDPTGAVKRLRLQFLVEPSGSASSVEVSDESGNTFVATRVAPAVARADDLLLIVGAAALLVLAILLAATIRRGRAAHRPLAAAGGR